ncbi:hypothetical protein L2X99_02860 [Microbacterium sp. KUDC0406]|uniref:hypothetical protein n=1 Tax=Microbacterium sp. KUDC0406 TaxID=2909588 RepID=UPI001F34C929|nr:hypothetical protein [Microbacterium sp. KUDC0406]UJP10631.1 hypothetical protein L2X99_02860 [Microbacterium sp. KUDC0406]
MTHRIDDSHRIRSAQHGGLDPETADRVMDREFRTRESRRDDRDVWDDHPVADPAVVALVASQIARDAVMPGTLAIACTVHDAQPGAYCFRGAHGVCGDRITRRMNIGIVP